ncbi:MAG: hypothetical protein DLM50_01000 [Candidatus Meridianibacter frigidus]|nr:MAG: hypothetical protein DLM50_01000 [Candidatus Eremiobacteraeota bacterium]
MVTTQSLLQDSISISGPPNAPPIVFLHGLHLGRYSWKDHIELLVPRFRCVTLDLPRHGTMSEVPFDDEHIMQQLDYLFASVLRRPALLVGYSLGGFIAILYAARAQEQTSGLILTGATLDLTKWRRLAYRVLISVGARIPSRIFEACSRAFFYATLPKALAQAVSSHSFDQHAFNEAVALLEGCEFSRLLERYRKPVLIINGQYDIIFRPQARHFARKVNAHVEVAPGSDHVFPLRRPDIFSERVASFYENLNVGTS